jgi:hypothetical protein
MVLVALLLYEMIDSKLQLTTMNNFFVTMMMFFCYLISLEIILVKYLDLRCFSFDIIKNMNNMLWSAMERSSSTTGSAVVASNNIHQN